MLRELHVNNLAVLAGAAVEFAPGFNVLTGETGAGKSIVVDSLALLAGARASTDLIRSGASSLTVVGSFLPAGDAWRRQLAEAGLEISGDELLVRREIQREGRNRVFLNDQPATLRLLQDLGPALLRIHGQREELGLVTPDLQRAWLDRSGGDEARRLLRETEAGHDRWSGLAARLAQRRGDEALRRERLDLLRFQASELDAARLEAGEDERLRSERDVLRHVEAIAAAVGSALEELAEAEGSVVERLARARQRVAAVTAWAPEASAWEEALSAARVVVDDVAMELRHRLDSLEADPQRLDTVEERLALLERLQRKYGATVADMLRRRQAIGAELDDLLGDGESEDELAARTAEALAAYRRAAQELSDRRRAWGGDLSERVVEQLAQLALPRARFDVELVSRADSSSPLVLDGRAVEFGPSGFDQVVFRFSPNPGEELMPLARAASGGELSRLYLALQLAAGLETDGDLPCLVFDEIDAGIGGAEGATLGAKLRQLAHAGQVLAVTHLAPVAAQGDAHFRVRKRVEGERTFAAVERLEAEERVVEVARMLAGREVTELALSHARELLRGESSAIAERPRSGRAPRRSG